MSSNKRRCGVNGCKHKAIEFVPKSKNAFLSNYCKRHTCRDRYGCKKRKRTNAQFCSKHKCPVPNCSEPAKPPHEHHHLFSSPPPATREPCAVNGCDEYPEEGYEFCERHECVQDGCPARAGQDDRCREHQLCQAEGCRGFRRWNRKTNSDPEWFCWDHEECKMQTCGNPVVAGGLHCDFHRCRLPGCRGQRDVFEAMSDFCRVHTCGTKGCPKPIEGPGPGFRYPPPNATRLLYRHCQEHTCNRPECVEESVVGFGPCKNHNCLAPDCDRSISGNHRYCETHECRSEGCIKPSSPIPQVPFCLEEHACQWPRDDAPCVNQRDLNNPSEGLCYPHAIRQAVMNGEEKERMRREQERQEEERERLRKINQREAEARQYSRWQQQRETAERERFRRQQQWEAPEWAHSDGPWSGTTTPHDRRHSPPAGIHREDRRRQRRRERSVSSRRNPGGLRAAIFGKFANALRS